MPKLPRWLSAMAKNETFGAVSLTMDLRTLSRTTWAETAMFEANTRAATTTGSPSHNLARNAFFLLVGQVASTALSVILTAVLARWLGVVEFGTYYLLATV